MHVPKFHHHNGRVADDCDHALFGINDDLRFLCLVFNATAPIPECEMPRVGSLGVMSREVVEPAAGCAAGCGVGSVVIVEVEPVG
nr:hypothetical protein [Paraoerskovia marina]